MFKINIVRTADNKIMLRKYGVNIVQNDGALVHSITIISFSEEEAAIEVSNIIKTRLTLAKFPLEMRISEIID